LSDHLVDRVDGFADIVRPTSEEVPDRLNAIASLGIANVAQIVLESSKQKLVLLVLGGAAMAIGRVGGLSSPAKGPVQVLVKIQHRCRVEVASCCLHIALLVLSLNLKY
jgi:hypothetical protein